MLMHNHYCGLRVSMCREVGVSHIKINTPLVAPPPNDNRLYLLSTYAKILSDLNDRVDLWLLGPTY